MKKIVSWTLAFSFLTMSLTGIMLFIVPKGKVAYWADWKMFGLSKTQYGEIHITSMFLFLVIAIWHIYYNWKPLISYIKNSARKVSLLKKEFLIGFGINLLFVVGTLMAVQPFKSIVDVNEAIKFHWEKTYGSPPYSHAEESSLKVFAQKVDLDLEDAIKRLEAAGIKVVSAEQRMEKIAKGNGRSPQAIYDIMHPKASKKGTHETSIPSLGRRTLQELAEMGKIDLKKSMDYLKEQGVEVSADTRMKIAADGLGVTPYDLFTQLSSL